MAIPGSRPDTARSWGARACQTAKHTSAASLRARSRHAARVRCRHRPPPDARVSASSSRRLSCAPGRCRRRRRDAGGERLAGDNRGFVLRRWLAVSDLAALILAWIASLAFATTFDRTPTVIDSVVFVALLPAWMAIANALGLYHLPDRRLGHSLADEIGPIILALTRGAGPSCWGARWSTQTRSSCSLGRRSEHSRS